MDEHIVKDLQMNPIPGDAALYIKKNELEEAIGITGMNGEDSLNGENPEFEKILGKGLEMFESKPREYD